MKNIVMFCLVALCLVSTSTLAFGGKGRHYDLDDKQESEVIEKVSKLHFVIKVDSSPRTSGTAFYVTFKKVTEIDTGWFSSSIEKKEITIKALFLRSSVILYSPNHEDGDGSRGTWRVLDYPDRKEFINDNIQAKNAEIMNWEEIRKVQEIIKSVREQ